MLNPRRRTARIAAIAFSLLFGVGCALTSGTLGGREKCWPESDSRMPSLWRGTVDFDAFGGRLLTPEGDVIPLRPGAVRPQVNAAGAGELVQGTTVVAKEGDDVTLWGGAGSDGALVVCAVEEIHSA